MPKTKDAYALRGFDTAKIFQRRYFRELKLPDVPDEEILNSTAAKPEDSMESVQRKISQAEKIQQKISSYQRRITRQVKRLEKILHAIEQKESTDAAEISALRLKRQRAIKLILSYTDKLYQEEPDERISILTSRESIKYFVADKDGAISEILKELYRAERFFYRKIFAERLKAARKAAGLTQGELGRLTGTPRRNISDFETSMPFEPSLPLLVKIAKALNRPVGWFLGVS